MRTELSRFLALSREDRRGFSLAWAYLLVADLALRFLPLARVQGLLARLPALPPASRPLPGRLASLVGSAARHHLRPATCLTRALTLQALLRRQGHQAELRIGVRREGGALQAHAWVEHAGSPLGDPAGVDLVYRPLSTS